MTYRDGTRVRDLICRYCGQSFAGMYAVKNPGRPWYREQSHRGWTLMILYAVNNFRKHEKACSRTIAEAEARGKEGKT